MASTSFKLCFYTVLALLAFAANSILCRLAIGSHAIDPTSFTIIRLISGIAMLWLCVRCTKQSSNSIQTGSWLAAFMLFTYAASFSYAYTLLDAGVGALILFGVVQITMVIVSLYSGERLLILQWLGLGMAFSGLMFLLIPQQTISESYASDPVSLIGYLLMVISGIAWAWYTLLGRLSSNPLLDTAHNFLKTTPLCLLLLIVLVFKQNQLTAEGIFYSVTAGAITSGLGYALWYQALQGLSKLQSGVLQLSVPLIAALGGVIFLSEALTTTLLISLIVILTGIFLVLYKKKSEKS